MQKKHGLEHKISYTLDVLQAICNKLIKSQSNTVTIHAFLHSVVCFVKVTLSIHICCVTFALYSAFMSMHYVNTNQDLIILQTVLW